MFEKTQNIDENARRQRIRSLLLSCMNLRTSSTTALRLCLECTRVILGLGKQNPQALKKLVCDTLLPLHSMQGKISPTQSRLGSFHKELTLAVCKACETQPDMYEQIIVDLAGSRFPQMSEGNSPKEVLFLHELERIVSECKTQLSSKARSTLVARLLTCIQSLHAAVCERALQFWQSDSVFYALQGPDKLLSKTCDRALAKTSLEHWSETVRSMAGASLMKSIQQEPHMTQDSSMERAIAEAKARASRAANPQPVKTFALPKTFTSTSVIRDATEPFAVGAFGLIWKGRAIVIGASKAQWPLIALKELEDSAAAKQELEAMTRIGPNPNLVTLLGVFELRGGSVVSLVLEFIDGPGDLHSVVVERGMLDVNQCKQFAGELGNALRFVHEMGYVFGDVKPENVLITNDGHVKLCDFGSAFSGPGLKSAQAVGTVEYMPPEQVSSVFGDWWAFGCVLHFMLCGRPPVFFDREDDSDLTVAFSRAVTFADTRGGSLVKDANGRALIAQLCARDPNNRPNDGGESHSFFANFRPWNTLVSKRDVPRLSPSDKSLFSTTRGPWARRTFSTILSPLPAQYHIDATFVQMCLGLDGLDDKAGLAISQSLAAAWDTNVSLSQALETSMVAIPKTRIPSTFYNGGLRAGGEKRLNNGGVGGEGGKMRRVQQANYSVAGVDLSAG